jgi:DNA-binding SARP family transcriptional activator
MSQLALYLLGPPRVEREGQAVHIGRRKALALLAYLAVEGSRSADASVSVHSRDTLTALFWPEYDQSDARADLRRTLSLLRRVLGEVWITADRETAGLDPDADLWLDVHQFRQRLAACEAHRHPSYDACPDCLALLTGAVELYRDDFLAGFTLPDSPAFDEWQRYQTQGLQDELGSALERLARCHSAGGEYETAIAYAQRWLALDPLRETTHRGLMTLYAQAGRRTAALRQYRECVRVLEGELGVPPSAETTGLYEHLQAQRRAKAEIAPIPTPLPSRPESVLPAFLRDDATPLAVEQPVFVARERELAQLSRHLETALAGQGRVVFVTGDPGRGKTTLMAEFARRAMEAHPDLLVASGVCNAYSGVGDPYLPFREALAMLTGDVEALWAAGAVSGAHARRLWETVPLASRALLDHGPFLIDTLVPGPALLSRATTCARASHDDGWLDQLRAWVEREKGEHSDLEQSALFTQLTNVLTTLSATHPLLFLLDDLQWADGGSIGLLFHLGRRLDNAQILIVAAYRPEEVAIARDGAPHPLQELLSEFRRLFGEVTLDLSQVDDEEGRRFVDSLLDAEPNRLSADFRAALHRHAGGHPLFTVELLRTMQERGDLIRDGEGLWVESQALDWARLPARVEAVIEKRVERLAQELRDLLAVASVEGEHFTAQVVAQVEGMSEREVLRALSTDLGPAGHHLVREVEETHITGEGRFLSRFRFAHALFQEYLYTHLSAGERRLLHGEVAAALEGLHGDDSEEIAAALAYHYDAAGRRPKALEYTVRAGDQALRAYAHEEAHKYYQHALELLAESPPGSGQTGDAAGPQTRSEKTWRLRASRGLGHVYLGSSQSVEAEACYREAIALGKEIGLAARELVQLHWGVGSTLFQQDRHAERIPLGEQGLALLGADTESAEAVLMYINLALGYGLSGNWEKWREFAYRAASILPHVRYTEALAVAYLVIAWTYASAKRIEEALAWAETFMEWAQAHQDLRDIAIANRARGDVLVNTGDLKRGLARYERERALYARIGKAEGHYWSPCLISAVLFALGDLSNANDYALECRDATDALGSARFSASNHMQRGRIDLCRGAKGRAAAAFRSALRCWRRLDHKLGKTWAVYLLGRLCLARGDPRRAGRWFQAALALVMPDLASGRRGSGFDVLMSESVRPDLFLWPSLLNGIEEACDDDQAFRAFCRCWREEYPELSESPFVQWYLEPVDTEMPGAPSRRGEWGDQPSDWAWHDPLGDCRYEVHKGLVIHAANGRDLWYINLSAPRLLRPAPEGDFGVQTVCAPAADDRPGIGGLLLWHDKENYLRLDRGTRGPREISFQGCIANQDVIIGRGRLQMSRWANGQDGRVFLRLERVGEWVQALCSADGEEWFSVGLVDFPLVRPLQVGLHAIGNIDRIIYPGAYPDGTAIRFESFTVWVANR